MQLNGATNGMKTKYSDKHYHYQMGRLPHHSGIRDYFRRHYSPEKRVLELGAGTGIGTIELANYFQAVVAVEPVAEMLAYGASIIRSQHVTFINADVENLGVHDFNYDYLICFQATHWFYKSRIYQELYKRAEKPVIDVCSFISFPADKEFFDGLALQHTIAQSHRGTKYPFEVAEKYSYRKQISVERAAHQLCSRSWVDHTNFLQIRDQIAARYDAESVWVNVETRIHNISLFKSDQEALDHVPAPVLITKAESADADQITNCINAAYRHYVARIGNIPGPMRDDYARVIIEHSVWVVRDNDKVAGVLVMIDKPDKLLLDNVAVHPDYQGQGIGRKLITFAETEAAQRGYDTIYLYTHEKMHENIALYARIGYVEFKRVTELGLNRVYMQKGLSNA